MDERIDREDLLARLHLGYSQLMEVLADLKPDQVAADNMIGQWSIKDVLAHLANWTRWPLVELRQARGESVDTSPFAGGSDETNARAVALSRAKSYDEVRADLDRAFHEVIDAISAL